VLVTMFLRWKRESVASVACARLHGEIGVVHGTPRAGRPSGPLPA